MCRAPHTALRPDLLHLIFGERVDVVRTVRGIKDKEPLKGLKSADVNTEGYVRGSPHEKRVEVRLFAEASIVVNVRLVDARFSGGGTTQGGSAINFLGDRWMIQTRTLLIRVMLVEI